MAVHSDRYAGVICVILATASAHRSLLRICLPLQPYHTTLLTAALPPLGTTRLAHRGYFVLTPSEPRLCLIDSARYQASRAWRRTHTTSRQTVAHGMRKPAAPPADRLARYSPLSCDAAFFAAHYSYILRLNRNRISSPSIRDVVTGVARMRAAVGASSTTSNACVFIRYFSRTRSVWQTATEMLF